VVGAANTEAQTTAPALLEDGATKTDGRIAERNLAMPLWTAVYVKIIYVKVPPHSTLAHIVLLPVPLGVMLHHLMTLLASRHYYKESLGVWR